MKKIFFFVIITIITTGTVSAQIQSDFVKIKESGKNFIITETNGLISLIGSIKPTIKLVSMHGRFIHYAITRIDEPIKSGSLKTNSYDTIFDNHCFSAESQEKMDIIIQSKGIYWISEREKQIRYKGLILSKREYQDLNSRGLLEKTLFKYVFPDKH